MDCAVRSPFPSFYTDERVSMKIRCCATKRVFTREASPWANLPADVIIEIVRLAGGSSHDVGHLRLVNKCWKEAIGSSVKHLTVDNPHSDIHSTIKILQHITRSFKYVTSLHLEGLMGIDGIDMVSQLPYLTSLHLLRVASSGNPLWNLTRFTNLEELGVHHDEHSLDFKDWTMGHLTNLHALTSLEICNARVSGSTRELGCSLSRMCKLDMSGCWIAKGLVPSLFALTTLHRLELCRTTMGDSDLGTVTALQGLTYLGLARTRVRNITVEYIAQLPRLRDLDLSCTNVRSLPIDDLGALTNLTALKLSQCKLGNSGVKSLSALTNLESLHVANTQVTEYYVRYVASLRNLRELDLSGNRVGDEGLWHLMILTNLVVLWLSSAKVHGRRLACISTMVKLEKLDLSHNPLCSGCLECLRSIVGAHCTVEL